MLRIAADYDELAEWAEKNSVPWDAKNRGEQVARRIAANVAKLPEPLRND